MLDKIRKMYQVLDEYPRAESIELRMFEDYFKRVPSDYRELVGEAKEIELLHPNGEYVCIWNPLRCIDTYEEYSFGRYMPGVIPIGSNGFGEVIFYATGNRGAGLYHVGYGNLDLQDAVWIAPSLREFLTEGEGIESF